MQVLGEQILQRNDQAEALVRAQQERDANVLARCLHSQDQCTHCVSLMMRVEDQLARISVGLEHVIEHALGRNGPVLPSASRGAHNARGFSSGREGSGEGILREMSGELTELEDIGIRKHRKTANGDQRAGSGSVNVNGEQVLLPDVDEASQHLDTHTHTRWRKPRRDAAPHGKQDRGEQLHNQTELVFVTQTPPSNGPKKGSSTSLLDAAGTHSAPSSQITSFAHDVGGSPTLALDIARVSRDIMAVQQQV